MKEHKDIREDEIRVIGGDCPAPSKPPRRKWPIAVLCAVVGVCVLLLLFPTPQDSEPQSYFEEEDIPSVVVKSQQTDSLSDKSEDKGYIEILEETVNDVPMFVYVPHHARMTLELGMPDKEDSTIVFVAQAADIRRDNKKILGDFVLKGEKLSYGKAKAGFCAVIDDVITIGVEEDTPLLQKAIDRGGYFFRQYPLVQNGQLIENNPKNKAIRRAIGIRQGQVVMIESRSTESFHDLTQALVDIGISQAIYLVGSTAYGWCIDPSGNRVEFGVENPRNTPPNTSYIVWRSK